MEITGVIECLIKDMANTFQQNFFLEQKERADLIFCTHWKNEMLKSLKDYDFEQLPLSNKMLTNWLLRYAHAICDRPSTNIFLKRKELKIKNKLPIYEPRQNILQMLKSPSTRNKNDDTNGVSQEIDRDNIYKVFKLLLELEDIENVREYLPLVQRNVQLRRSGNRLTMYFQRSTPHNVKDILTAELDEAVIIPRLPTVPFDVNNFSDVVKQLFSLSENKENKAITATIIEVTSDRVKMESDKKKNKIKESDTFDVIFRSRRYPVRYQNRALCLLLSQQDMCKYLFPGKGDTQQYSRSKDFSEMVQPVLVNENIAYNPEQLEAVRNIMAGPNGFGPYIVFGPPGTGKTTTIVESILQLRLTCPESRILVTAGSNSACDTIAQRLLDCFEDNTNLQQHLLGAMVLPMLRIYSKSVTKNGKLQISYELRQHSNLEWKDGGHAYPSVEDIQCHGIIIATLCTVGKLVIADVSVNNFFTHVFIDEAGASCEPETLVGIMGIKNGIESECCVILSGDHKQLGPVLKSKSAEKLGLGKSLMERLLERECYAVDKNGNYDRSLQIRLRRNYRSHPEIVQVYNSLYYNKELIPMLAQKTQRHWSFLPNQNFPIAFQAVFGETVKANTYSSCNMLEVSVLISYVKRLVRTENAQISDIGVITPYKLQCERIKEAFKFYRWDDIEVGSIETYQGREKKIIIASMVRSNCYLGFLKNPKRFNVLLSRPISLLLIIGNPSTLSAFKDMNFVIKKCTQMGNFFNFSYSLSLNVERQKTKCKSQKCQTPKTSLSALKVENESLNTNSVDTDKQKNGNVQRKVLKTLDSQNRSTKNLVLKESLLDKKQNANNNLICPAPKAVNSTVETSMQENGDLNKRKNRLKRRVRRAKKSQGTDVGMPDKSTKSEKTVLKESTLDNKQNISEDVHQIFRKIANELFLWEEEKKLNTPH